VARFVAASLDLPKWDPTYTIVGDKLTWNEFLSIAEEAKGNTSHAEAVRWESQLTESIAQGTKFETSSDSTEYMKTGHSTELPGQVFLYQFAPKEMFRALATSISLLFDRGTFNLDTSHTMNHLFPAIKTKTAREVVTAVCKGA
jgi:hypothetical protein